MAEILSDLEKDSLGNNLDPDASPYSEIGSAMGDEYKKDASFNTDSEDFDSQFFQKTGLYLQQQEAKNGIPGVTPGSGASSKAGDVDFFPKTTKAKAALDREPTGIFSGVIDVLSRAQYAEVAMVDEWLTGDKGIKAIGTTLARGAKEFFVPNERLSFADLIGKYDPEFAKENPIATIIAGTAMDIALDPTTWLSFGAGMAGKAVKVAGKTGETLYLTSKGVNTFKHLTQMTQKGISADLISDAARFSWAEEKIAHLASIDPSLVVKKGFQVHATVPFSNKHLGTILSPESSQMISEATGLTKLKSVVKTYFNESSTYENVKGVFRPVNSLPPEYQKLANTFLNVAENATEDIIKMTAKMAKGVNRKGAEKIGKVAYAIRDEIGQIMKETGQVNGNLVKEIQLKWFAKEGLGDKEISVYAAMRHGLNEMKWSEHNLGLLTDEVSGYYPRYYSNIKELHGESGELFKNKKFADKLKSSEPVSFETTKDAIAAGYIPEWNAVKSFSMRATASRKAVAKKGFDESVDKLVQNNNFSKKTADLIRRDAREIGESIHPNFDKAWMNSLVNAHDIFLNSVFRPSATVLKPAFTFFQISANNVQVAWTDGLKTGAKVAGGVVRNIVDNVGSGLGGKYWESMRKTLGSIDPYVARSDSALVLNNLDNPAAMRNSLFTTDIGTTFNGETLVNWVNDMRIAQGTSLMGVPAMKKSAMGEVRRLNAITAVSDKTGVSEGFVDFVSSAASYWAWPRQVEDMARTNFFITALKQGHSPHEAAKLVNKGLYDYTAGLSKFERMWIKRIIPFYSFTRFTLPMAASSVGTKPGRLLNTARGHKLFFGAWNKIQGGEQLNESERQAIPGWILEQPSTFAKFGKDGRAHFNTFINLTPLDAVNFMASGDDERSTIQKTVEKTVLSMMTPIIKLPLEHILNRSFFTGRVLKDAYRVKDRLGGKGMVWNSIDKVLTENQKEAIGWEIGRDKRTGRENVYINPYLAHYSLGMSPVLNTVVRVFDGDLTARESAMQVITNVATFKVDMQRSYSRMFTSENSKIRDLKRQITYLKSKGMDASAETYAFELKELMEKTMMKREQRKSGGRARGPKNMPDWM